MFKSLESALLKIFAKQEDDPQATITADQLAIVLKSIEKKYNELTEENRRLHDKVAQQQRTIATLEQALDERPASADR